MQGSDVESAAASPQLSPGHGRVCVVLAAVCWSTSGAFTRILTSKLGLAQDAASVFGLDLALSRALSAGVLIAFYRAFFASLVLMPTLRRADVSFRALMPVMIGCFALMNASFVVAMAGGKSSNAILLQYTGPMWMYLGSVWWLGEPPNRRSSVALFVGLLGIAVIIAGGWKEAQLAIIAVGLLSGVTYAGVMLCLRVLREASSRWLTVLNLLCSAAVVLPFFWLLAPPVPTWSQLGVLVLYGALQTALPYWLVARGLRVISPQEAGAITLLEPILNPLWAWMVAPEEEVPSVFTLIGGAFILGGLAWRYWPRQDGRRGTP
jgi:drug/metabolite transporter (DMT)-like permease